MNQFEDEQHIFMPTGRNDTSGQECGFCGKPFQVHVADVNEAKLITGSVASARPPITWEYHKGT